MCRNGSGNEGTCLDLDKRREAKAMIGAQVSSSSSCSLDLVLGFGSDFGRTTLLASIWILSTTKRTVVRVFR